LTAEGQNWFRAIVIKRTILGKGTLRKVTGVVFVVEAGSAEIFFSLGTVERDTRMTVCFKRNLTVGTGDRRSVYRLATTGTMWHGEGFSVQKRKSKIRNLYAFRMDILAVFRTLTSRLESQAIGRYPKIEM
jgi:hypothetical protein